jgi:hypothetical protein
MGRIARTARVVSALAVAVAGTAIIVPHATAHPAKAPSVTTNTGAAPQSVTLLWVDADTGSVTRSWTGSAEEGAILRNAPYPTSGATAQTSQQAGTVSPSIVREYGCTLPNGYWDVRASSLVCYAYAGDISTWITYTYEVDAGNNSGWFTYYYGGVYHSISLARWTSAILSARVTVSHVHIY